MSDLQTVLRAEHAQRFAERFTPFVVSGGTHGTLDALTGTPDALTAYPGGYYVTETAGITYPDNTNCWVVATHSTTAPLVGSFARVAGTKYATDCVSPAQPAAPANSVWLMHVTTAGGAITAVQDYRELSPVARSVAPTWGVTNVKLWPYNAAGDGTTDDTAAIQAALTASHNVYFPPGNYLLTSDLLVTNNDSYLLMSSGVQFTQDGVNNNILNLTNVTNVTIAANDALFLCKGTYDPGLVEMIGHQDRAIQLGNVTNVRVIRPHTRKCGVAGVAIMGGTDILLDSPRIEGTHLYGVPLAPLNNWQMGIWLNESTTYGAINNLRVVTPHISHTAQGIMGGRDSGVVVGGKNRVFVAPLIHDIIGQHGVYANIDEYTFISPVITRVALNCFKMQADDGFVFSNMVVTDLNASNCTGDSGIAVAVPRNGTLRNIQVTGVVHDASRGVSIGAVAASNGVTVAGNPTVTTADGIFTAAHVGQVLVIPGAGAAGATYTGTIVTFNDPTSVDMNPSPSTSVNPATILFQASSVRDAQFDVIVSDTTSHGAILNGYGLHDIDLRIKTERTGRHGIYVLARDSDNLRIWPTVREAGNAATQASGDAGANAYDGINITSATVVADIFDAEITDADANMRNGMFNAIAGGSIGIYTRLIATGAQTYGVRTATMFRAFPRDAVVSGVKSNYHDTTKIPFNGTISLSYTYGDFSAPGLPCIEGTCTGSDVSGTRTILTATPDPGYQLERWKGCSAAIGNQCTIDATQVANVSVTFRPIAPLLTVIRAGDGTGTVVSEPAGFRCGDVCNLPFATGQSVTLTAAAAPGASFQGWSGEGCSGTGTCTVTMSQARSVTATFTIPVPPLAGLALYDDFTAPGLDKGKWQPLEVVRELRDGRLVLAYRAIGPPGIGGTDLPVAHPDTIQAFAADVRLTAVETEPATTARVGLRGSYYSDGTVGLGATGDVRAELYLTRNAAGDGLDIRYHIYRCANSACTDQNSVVPPASLGTAALGALRTLGIAWSGTAFIFTVNGVDTAVNPTGIQPVGRATPSVPEKTLSSQLLFNGAGAEGYVAGDFDRVLADGLPYDDFSAAWLDATKWSQLERVSEVKAGHLVTKTAGSGSAGTTTTNFLRFLNQNGVTATHAAVTILEASMASRDTVELQALGGSFYNDGASTGATDRTGDVHALVRLVSSSGGPLTAEFLAERCANEACDTRTSLGSDTLGTVGVGETHHLFLTWDGSLFTFGLDATSRTFDPKPQAPLAKPAIESLKTLGTQVQAGADGNQPYLAATIDDVFTNAPAVPPPHLSQYLTRALQGGVAAAGVGLRGTGAGTIEVTGIPLGATVDLAYLYWATWGTSDTATSLTLNGTAVTGTRIGQGAGAEGAAQAFAYRANVTEWITGNGTYAIADLPHAGTAVHEALGATLVVLYALEGVPAQVVLLHDGVVTLGGAGLPAYATPLTDFTVADPVVGAKAIFVVGAGQAATAAVAGVNATLLATDAFQGGDGSTWDTKSYDASRALTPSDISATVRLGATVDPLVWVAAVLSVPGTRAAVPLTVMKSGTGLGTVAASVGILNCGTDCSELYAAGASVTLTATPATGSRFEAWGGACTGASPTCTLTVDQSATVTASFRDTALPTVTHTRVTSGAEFAPISITAMVTDNSVVQTVMLFYRSTGGSTYTSIAMTAAGTRYAATIPPSAVTKTGIQYYLEARDAANNVRRVPSTAPGTPYSVVVGTAVFTDDPLLPGSMPNKAAHLLELRTAINKLRPFDWKEPAPAPGGAVRGAVLTELRTALNAAYDAAKKPRPSYTDPTITPGVTLIKASHLNELRTFVRGLE